MGVGSLSEGMVRKESPPLDVALAELAERQWGVVSLAKLRELGLGSRAVQQRASAGRLRRLYRGVYAVGHARIGREGRWLAAVFACGEGAVLSHASAAAHWELLATSAALINVTAPRGRHAAPGIRLHRSRSLDVRDTDRHRGIPITSVPRTLLDLAATVKPHRLERALAQAERLRLYDNRAIEDAIARSNGHRGTGALKEAIARHDPKWTRTDLEAWFLTMVREAGLPEPMVNASLTAPDHPRLDPDFCWPSHRAIVETDGWETHRTRAAFERDRARDAALIADGWRVIRLTGNEPRETIERRLEALLHH